jgi:hypothetical protein
MQPSTSRQLWVNAFPALAGFAVALGSLGSGGSLWQSGAAALATGMTGYLASVLSGSEAKANIQMLEHSLEHFKRQQEQNEATLLGLKQLQNELADLQAALANWAQVRQERMAVEKPDSQAHFDLGSQIRSQQERLEQLRAEEQSLKASIEDLQTKKQELVQFLKEYIAKIEQLRSKRDLLAQEIARLNQARQSTGSSSFAVHSSMSGKGSPGFSSISASKTVATSASVSTYDEILAAIEERVSDLDDMAKAMTELGLD